MHVCQLIDGFSNAGAQRLVAYFAGQARINGVKVTAVGLNEPKSRVICDELERQGARIEIFPAKKLSDLKRVGRLARFLRSEKFDVIQTHLSYANILGSAAGRIAGIPVVATLHTSNYKNQFYRPVVFRTEMAMLRFASAKVIAVAKAVADVYRPFLGGKEIAVIPNPVQPVPEISKQQRIEIRSQFLPGQEAPLLIAVGRLTAPKGYTDMLRAFEEVLAIHADARLIIAGAGEEYNRLKKLIEEPALAGKVFLLGERQDVPKLLCASDIFLSASYWEGMPVSVLEAMSAGLAVVATKVGGVPEILEGRGLLVPPHEPEIMAGQIISLLADPDQMKTLGIAAQEYAVEGHSPEKWFSELIGVFRSLT